MALKSLGKDLSLKSFYQYLGPLVEYGEFGKKALIPKLE